MSHNNFPENWNADKLQDLLAHYEKQSEEDAVLEDEAALRSLETVMSVPHELVPTVRDLIAKHQR